MLSWVAFFLLINQVLSKSVKIVNFGMPAMTAVRWPVDIPMAICMQKQPCADTIPTQANGLSRPESVCQIATVKLVLASTCPLLLTTSTRHDPAYAGFFNVTLLQVRVLG